MRKEIGEHYRMAHERIEALVADLGDEEWATDVPACPGWRVRDVVAHLVATLGDAAAGRIAGIPDDEFTADQVRRLADREPADLLALWNDGAAAFESLITEFRIWPAAIDAVSHEHDLRHALGRSGAQDHETVGVLARILLKGVHLPVGLSVRLGDEVVQVTEGPDALTLATDSFEVLRLRTGRRTLEQIASLDWSGDPSGIVASLPIFGPTPVPIVER